MCKVQVAQQVVWLAFLPDLWFQHHALTIQHGIWDPKPLTSLVRRLWAFSWHHQALEAVSEQNATVLLVYVWASTDADALQLGDHLHHQDPCTERYKCHSLHVVHETGYLWQRSYMYLFDFSLMWSVLLLHVGVWARQVDSILVWGVGGRLSCWLL